MQLIQALMTFLKLSFSLETPFMLHVLTCILQDLGQDLTLQIVALFDSTDQMFGGCTLTEQSKLILHRTETTLCKVFAVILMIILFILGVTTLMMPALDLKS
jgi:hypothetical protein